MRTAAGRRARNGLANAGGKRRSRRAAANVALPRTMACPSCLLGALHFNGLFQLICDTCGRVAEAGVFT
jgi:hypothetical protein